MAARARFLLALFAALAAMTAATGAAAAKLIAHGSAGQIYATGLKAGQPVSLLSLLSVRGKVTAIRRADSLGGVVFRLVTPGRGYRVRQGATRSRGLTVFSDRPAPVSTRVYGQKLATSGYGYLTTRDGTKLAYDVHLPAGPGPYPTLTSTPAMATPTPCTVPISGLARWPTSSASRSWTSTCAAPAVRAARMTSLSRCRAWTAMM